MTGTLHGAVHTDFFRAFEDRDLMLKAAITAIASGNSKAAAKSVIYSYWRIVGMSF